MAERKSSFPFRFWPSSTPASRRSPATQTTTSTATTTTPPKAETQTPGRQLTTTASSPPNPTTSSKTDEPKTSSQLASPSRQAAQSRSPSQPSSPSMAAPQARSTPSSSLSRKASQSRSPSRSPEEKSSTSSTKATKPNSPSKESRRENSSSYEAPTSASNERGPKPAASQQEPQHKAEDKSDSATKPNSPSKESRQTTQEISSSYEASQTSASNEKGPKPAASQQEPQLKAEVKSDSATKPNSPSKESRRTIEDISNSYEAPPTSASNEKGVKPAASQQEPQLKVEVKSDSATKPNSPSKESRQTSPEISSSNEAPTSASDEKGPEPAASEREPQLEEDVKSDSANDLNDQTRLKHSDVVVVPPSKSSELGTEVNAKPEETKDVKEVVQATNSEANEEAKKEVKDLLAPKSGTEAQIIDKAKIRSKPNVKSINTTTSQPKKRSTISNSHNKPVPPIGGHETWHKDIRDDISTFVNRMAVGDRKSAIYDRPVSVITLAGENRGASMQMGSNSSKREEPVHIHRSYKINPDESAEATTDGEGSSKEKKSEDGKNTKDQPTEAYVNNNTQGINNSMVLNGSLTERNPGVHMVVNHVPKESIQPTDKISQAEFNMARSEKLSYEPPVRRRCLRGLLLETSDSDPENPEKPRHHGCRVVASRGINRTK